MKLASLAADKSYWLALSGGLDSRVLLHWLVNHQPQLSLQIVHIHHDLHEDADKWAEFCQQACASHGFNCEVIKIAVPANDSVETAARAARYQALGALLQPDEVLLTAHHQDDQAETILINLLRGSGAKGLAGIPAGRSLGQGQLQRPLLGVTRAELLVYAKQHGLDWIEDPSNNDVKHRRNHLRQVIMPALVKRWPAAVQTLARSADLQREAADLLEQLAAEDYTKAQCDQREHLNLEAVRTLSPERQRNLLRYWLQINAAPPLTHQQLHRVQQDFINSSPSAKPLFEWCNCSLRRITCQPGKCIALYLSEA